jgi:hypothetical protein
MEFNKVFELMEQACRDCILEIECPICGAAIVIIRPETLPLLLMINP